MAWVLQVALQFRALGSGIVSMEWPGKCEGWNTFRAARSMQWGLKGNYPNNGESNEKEHGK